MNNDFISNTNRMINVSALRLSPVETGNLREKIIVEQLNTVASMYDKELSEPITRIDARGEIMFAVKGRYGDELAKLLSAVPRRTGIQPYDGPVIPKNNWGRLFHFDAERLICIKTRELAPLLVEFKSTKNNVPIIRAYAKDYNQIAEYMHDYVDAYKQSISEILPVIVTDEKGLGKTINPNDLVNRVSDEESLNMGG